jgi:ribose 5-phosphate isomerase A
MTGVGEIEREKRFVAEAAAEMVESGMTVGLGTGSTVAYLLPALAVRRLDVRYVTSSTATEDAARQLGLQVESFVGRWAPSRLDLTVDGADQVTPSAWLVKGGGGAHTREKALAAAADRFVVIVSSNKMVKRPSPPIPLELSEYGLAATLVRLGRVRLRDAAHSPDGGVIADFLGDVDDPGATALRLSSMPGVVEHGLFAPALVSEILVARGGRVDRIPAPRAPNVAARPIASQPG